MADQERHDPVHDLLKQHAALRTAQSLDPRYAIEAYHFVCEAVDYTCRKLEGRRHVSGRGRRNRGGWRTQAAAPKNRASHTRRSRTSPSDAASL